ncbi:hypothetical protein SAMD00023353_1001580 [Rosellinia necatrix]|uniref:Uncharacterized protein n=1 Tax=Rosellinia necatrix TaxID=77044 RepID=A0A1W2TBQ2_ROSNE|nr:hypothetical protein SAMD00023353_1001580 [Rosellinia necatrix]
MSGCGCYISARKALILPARHPYAPPPITGVTTCMPDFLTLPYRSSSRIQMGSEDNHGREAQDPYAFKPPTVSLYNVGPAQDFAKRLEQSLRLFLPRALIVVQASGAS